MDELKQKIIEWIAQVEKQMESGDSRDRIIKSVIKSTLFRVYALIEKIEEGGN